MAAQRELPEGRLQVEPELSRPATLPRPDRDRAGALVALILIAYGLIRLIELPAQTLEGALLGLLVRIDFDTRFVLLSLAAALAASGMDWVLASHPNPRPVGAMPRLLPGMAALGIGAILSGLPAWPAWPVGLALGGLLLYAVLLAEFVVWDPGDPRAPFARLGLRWLGMLLTVGVAYAVRAGDVRAVFSVPVLLVSTGLVTWRLLGLERPRRPLWPYAVTAGWVTAQLGWSLHYWPLEPVPASLLLGVAAYLCAGLGRLHLAGRSTSRTVAEFGGIGLVVVGGVLLLAR